MGRVHIQTSGDHAWQVGIPQKVLAAGVGPSLLLPVARPVWALGSETLLEMEEQIRPFLSSSHLLYLLPQPTVHRVPTQR